MSQYLKNLIALKQAPAHVMKEIGDQWRTPAWLFHAVDHLFGPFALDLFTDGQNSHCDRFYTVKENAITQPWAEHLRAAEEQTGLVGLSAFGNPPFSRATIEAGIPITGKVRIMEKAFVEHLRGAKSVWIVPTSTSEDWWPNDTATQIIHIKCRIPFDVPHWYKADPMATKSSGAGFPCSIIIFSGNKDDSPQREQYINREELKAIGKPLAEANAAARKAWLNDPRWEVQA